MIRAVELALFAAPVLVFLFWLRLRARWRTPGRSALLAALAALIVLGAALAWTGLNERHPEGTHYVPATLEGGRVVPPHGT